MKKKILSFILITLMLVQCISVIPVPAQAAEYTGTGTFTQCTGALTSGYYVFGVGNSADSINALKTTAESNWIRYNSTTSTSGTITDPDAVIVWYYDATAGTFNNGTNYIAWPTTGNSAGLETNGTPLTVTETATAGVYNITVTATPARMLRCNATNSGYRFYTSNTGTNTFYFFKMQEAKHEHSYVWNNAVGADGSHTLTCANTDGKCDATTKTEDCTWEDGYCSVCGAKAPECAHPTTTEVAEVPATCTEIGYTAGVQCTVCNQYTSGHEEIEALDHNLVTDAAVAATCTETGLTEGSHCDREGCGHIAVEQEETPMIDHNYVGNACSVCGTKKPAQYRLVTNITELKAGNQIVIACMTKGAAMGAISNTSTTTYGMKVDVAIANGVLTEADGIKVVTLEAGENGQWAFKTDAGYLTWKSGNSLAVSEEIAYWTISIDEDGNATIKSTNDTTRILKYNVSSPRFACYTSGQTAINILKLDCDHANKVAIGEAKDATCTEEGITAGEKCADCGEIITAQETIAAPGHKDENPVDSKCDTCGTNLCTEHTWVDGEVIEPATCTKTGLQEQICQNCGEFGEDKVLDKTPHTSVTDAAVEASCTDTGLTEGSHCSVCEEVLVEQEVVDMIDHNYVDGICSKCGDIKVTGSQLAEFQFGANGNASHKDGTEIKEGETYTSGDYSLNFTTASKVYGGAFDAKGNSALKLGTSSAEASFSFTVPDNVDTVVLYIAGYKDKEAKIKINGTEYAITSQSDTGDYTKIVVNTSENKTVTLTTLSGGYRAMVDSIGFWGEEVDKASGCTVVLGDNIGVNFYWNLTDATLADSTAYIAFTLPNGETKQVPVAEGANSEYGYKFTANIAVKEMADSITATLYVGGEATAECRYSVKEYAMYIVNATSGYSDTEKALAKALLNYGAYAQEMFGYHTDKLANADLEDNTLANVESIPSVKAAGAAIAGVTCKGCTAVWESDTAIRFYFDITGENVTFTFNGEALEVQDGEYGKYVEIGGIVAKNMGTAYTLTVSNGAATQEITYSVYSYFQDIISGNFEQAEKNAAIAGYLYGQAATAYLAEKNG